MKQFSILLLGLLIAVMTVNVATAKGRKHSSSSRSGIPSAKTMMEINRGNPDEVKATTGLDLLYEKDSSYVTPDDPDITCEEYICYYGKDAKVKQQGDKITVFATGSHAFYYYFEYYAALSSDRLYEFGFKNKSDRDKFYKQLKKLGYSSSTLFKTYSDGWYIISIDLGL